MARVAWRSGGKCQRKRGGEGAKKRRDRRPTDELCDNRSCRRADIAGMTSNDGHCMIWSNARHIVEKLGLSRSWTSHSRSIYYKGVGAIMQGQTLRSVLTSINWSSWSEGMSSAQNRYPGPHEREIIMTALECYCERNSRQWRLTLSLIHI